MFKSESTRKLNQLKLKYDEAYYNGEGPLVDDQTYDALVEELKLRSPNTKLGIGCKINNSNDKVKLPVFMGSMEKIKLEEPEKLKDWISKNQASDYIVSNKLNGVSCLITYKNLKVTLYTRGDGSEGRDISYFADKIKHIVELQKDTEIVVRGEIVISKEKFNSKYKDKFSNELGLVVGTINSKTLREAVFDFDFVAYELVSCKPTAKPEENFNHLKELGFKVANFFSLSKEKLSVKNLALELEAHRQKCEYDIDGLIVQSNVPYSKDNTSPDGNPKYAFAFKMYNEIVETDVQEVEWNVSKWGCLKPRITVSPVLLGGSTVTHATGIHAKFILENLIGKGARVKITKSGDIIPKIVEVVKPAKKADLPSCKYVWNETGIDIFKQDEEKSDCIPLLVHFFVSMDIKEINEGVVAKLVNCGYNTVQKILELNVEQLLGVPTIKLKMAERIFTNIHSVLGSESGIKLSKLMVASGVFQKGFGMRRAEDLVQNLGEKIFSDAFILNENISVEEVTKINGFSKLSAEKLVSNLSEFNAFLFSIKKHIKFIAEKQISTSKGKIYVFSGFRSENLKKTIEDKGGVVEDTLTRKITMLVVSDDALNDPPTSKMKSAAKYNIPVLNVSKFMDEVFKN
jgi:DNA ligase (NAD+)